jgi:hypothetical protein
MGTDADGLPTRPFRGSDGRFHIPGTLEVATGALLKKILAAAMPVVDAAGGAQLVFVLPIPRYVTQQCCADPDHIINREEADYQHVVAAAGRVVRAVLEGESEKRQWNAVIFDPMTSFCESDILSETVSSAGIGIWSVLDGVHLTNTAYKDILDHLRQTVVTVEASVERNRERIPSIIPAGTPAQRDAIPVPAWISGGESYPRGGYRGRGAFRGRRGRRGRWAPY